MATSGATRCFPPGAIEVLLVEVPVLPRFVYPSGDDGWCLRLTLQSHYYPQEGFRLPRLPRPVWRLFSARPRALLPLARRPPQGGLIRLFAATPCLLPPLGALSVSPPLSQTALISAGTAPPPSLPALPSLYPALPPVCLVEPHPDDTRSCADH